MSITDNPTPKPVINPPKIWEPDPWLDKSEFFYSEIYAGGKCKYCGMAIPNDLAICDCSMMKIARDNFKREIGALPAKKEYNPNAFIEPEEHIF